MDYRDPMVFDEVYRTLYAPLFRFVYFRVKDRDLAEDITQETFLKFLKAQSTFTGASPLWYLHTVARNAVIDHYRKKKPDYDDEALWALASDEPDAEALASLGEDAVRAMRAMATLPPGEEEAVRLRYLDGLDTAEIASYADKSEEAVRQLVSRGIRRIRSILEGTYE